MARFDAETAEAMAATSHLAEAGIPGSDEVRALMQKGFECATGRTGAADLISAHMWFNLAAIKGCREAVRYRKEISGEMSADEIAIAQKQAREWLSLQ